jgi:D-2-hydroxyacid dehydrogenase (NADP+)
MFPSESDLTICFAHVAYQLQQRFALRKLPIRNFGTSHDDLVPVSPGRPGWWRP